MTRSRDTIRVACHVWKSAIAKYSYTIFTKLQEELSQTEFLIGVYNYGSVHWILVVSHS